MRVPLFAVLAFILLFGCHALRESDNYYDYSYPGYYEYPEPEPEVPTLISSQKLSEIENVTQYTVIRLIKRENRRSSKNMEDATERCTELGAAFEEKCVNCREKPDLIGPILEIGNELAKLHPIYWNIYIGKKIFKKLKGISVRKIVKDIGKNFKKLGKRIREAWRKVGRKLSRTVRRITGRLRRLVRVRLPRVRVRLPSVRVRLPRIKLPRVRVRLPRVRLPRVRVRLPRVRLPKVRVRLPRVRLPRVRVPRIRFRYPRVRVRFGRRRWGKKKRSTCSDCERIANMNEQDRIKSLCPFLLSVNEKSSQTDKFLETITSEVESGFPRLEKILHHHYLSSDEAEVTISAKEGKHTYKVKKFSKLSTQQIGRAVGRYIFNKAKANQ